MPNLLLNRLRIPFFALLLLMPAAAWSQAGNGSVVAENTAPDLPSAPEPSASALTETVSLTPQQSGTQSQQKTSDQEQKPGLSQHQQAEQDVKAEEKQRVLGVLPQFNMTNNQNAPPLSVGQKFDLAWHSAVDPVTFATAAVDAGISQAQNAFAGYGQGAQGYFKRFGASYADTFDSDIIGNGALPALLHQDPRYFRLGHGSFAHRAWYAAIAAVRCKSDKGRWQFNTSNVVGNVITGGISNIYYPSTDRGVGLTFERAFTVTAEGALGAEFIEFWPDIRDHLHHPKNRPYVPASPTDKVPPENGSDKP